MRLQTANFSRKKRGGVAGIILTGTASGSLGWLILQGRSTVYLLSILAGVIPANEFLPILIPIPFEHRAPLLLGRDVALKVLSAQIWAEQGSWTLDAGESCWRKQMLLIFVLPA